jgi:hypothetical protein
MSSDTVWKLRLDPGGVREQIREIGWPTKKSWYSRNHAKLEMGGRMRVAKIC